jgi:hypothetical protein
MGEWRAIPGFPGYEVSSDGRLRSWLGLKPPRYLRTGTQTGYHHCRLRDRKGVFRSLAVHRVVAAVFIGPCPAGKEVNHKDHNPSNNRPENLEYVTRRENLWHAIRAGRAPQLQRGPWKVDDVGVAEIRPLREQGWTLQQIADRLGVSRQCVWAYLNGKYRRQPAAAACNGGPAR